MSSDNAAIKDIDAYIASCPFEYQARLEEIRAIIKRHAPGASERISYGMPTFYQNGNLIHFALAKKHIGIYPGPLAIEAFIDRFDKEDLAYSKGALQLPLDRDLPLDLIRDLVLFNVNTLP